MSRLTYLGVKNSGTQFFFWLGVFVLPIFWSWFTLSRAFSKKQRVTALSWLVAYCAAVAWKWAVLSPYFKLLPFGYPLISIWLTMALGMWLLARLFDGEFRKMEVWQIVGGCVMGFDMLGRLAELVGPLINIAVWKAGPCSMAWIWPPLILAIIHCLLDSIKRGLARLLALSFAL